MALGVGRLGIVRAEAATLDVERVAKERLGAVTIPDSAVDDAQRSLGLGHVEVVAPVEAAARVEGGDQKGLGLLVAPQVFVDAAHDVLHGRLDVGLVGEVLLDARGAPFEQVEGR